MNDSAMNDLKNHVAAVAGKDHLHRMIDALPEGATAILLITCDGGGPQAMSIHGPVKNITMRNLVGDLEIAKADIVRRFRENDWGGK